ncbi:recombinase family protein [Bifidobacterium longum]|jgi:DNA invertase Pin-like site-specific DNA recombinase|uniref:recombinase family protein n=1 Tax=Bifidobacterium longum TaxID=216816 RepID=UPI00076183A7|nr:recombinase family protein [Bifidobacterium longum]OQM68959.1 Site-specific recombinase, DNA invertase Pin [Bifidobacterium longum subsp. infantis]QUF87589.1 recombinase family protein [Bifidobacterium longum subsp. infantis]UPT08965.1 recombinase family protein [Bifidobacterium longum subsp. infantis]UUY27196.1 recombinase family protein [Bifidobacterium longum subsp. infantis]
MSPLKVGYARVSTDEQNLTAQRDGLAAREVKLSIAGSVYDPTDPMGKLLFNVLAMVAEFEADLIRARTREGMRVAKGRLRGKSPKLTPRQEAHLVQLHAADEHTVGELAELFSVGRSTVYRALQRAERGRENALQ